LFAHAVVKFKSGNSPPELVKVYEKILPGEPINVMAQFHPDNFCDPAIAKYRDRYAEMRAVALQCPLPAF
jgi:hypothetical protein